MVNNRVSCGLGPCWDAVDVWLGMLPVQWPGVAKRLTTPDGIPVAFELVPANTDEQEAAEEVLRSSMTSHIVKLVLRRFFGIDVQVLQHRGCLTSPISHQPS